MRKIVIDDIQPGSILLSAPTVFLGQEASKYTNEVIVITSKTTFGVEGLVINRKEDETGPGHAFAYFHGGRQMRENTSIIHSIPHEIGHKRQIGNGVYLGGNLKKAEALIDCHMVDERDIRLYKGQYLWPTDAFRSLLYSKVLLSTGDLLGRSLLMKIKAYKFYDQSYLWGEMYEKYMERHPLHAAIYNIKDGFPEMN